MKKKQRKRIFLILASISFLFLCIFVIFFPPSTSFQMSFLSLPILIPVLLLLFILIYSVIAFIFRSFVHGILIGLFPAAYVVLRLNDLKSPLFLVLLAGIFIALELLLTQYVKKPL